MKVGTDIWVAAEREEQVSCGLEFAFPESLWVVLLTLEFSEVYQELDPHGKKGCLSALLAVGLFLGSHCSISRII